jgi:hypothetical protein
MIVHKTTSTSGATTVFTVLMALFLLPGAALTMHIHCSHSGRFSRFFFPQCPSTDDRKKLS